ncbi:MAG TPA: hypothetical protein ENI23_05705 [bacterium]|nr:hypothetical protein [bacterium]
MNREKGGRILRMIKSFLRRWIITNILYHFCRVTEREWIQERDFIDWVLGYGINENAPLWWYQNLPKKVGKIKNWLLDWLLNTKLRTKRTSEIHNIISECGDVGYIKEHQNGTDVEIMVDTRGLEIYSVSYLILGHDYARKIWTGVIVGLVIWFTIDRIESITPPTIQIEYVQIPI